MSFLQRIISVSAALADDTALVDRSRSLSYLQLRQMSNILAHHLRVACQSEQGFVALLLPRTVFFPVAAVGVLKAGYAFVPMSVDNTEEYNLSVLADSAPSAIVSTSDMWSRLTYLHPLNDVMSVILMDELLERAGLEDGDIDLSSDDGPAMLIYTSGTTGHPKAVLHSVRSLSEVCEYCTTLDADVCRENKARAAVLDFCFLAGVLDFFASMMVGGECHIVPDDVVRNIDLMAEYLKENNILSVTTIGHVAKMLVPKGSGVRYFEVTGGQMPVVEELLPEDVVIRNSYGMTECGACISYLVKGRESPVPIGKPVKGVHVYLLDDDLDPVPEGQTGEIFISSDGLTMGYFHDEALTGERFMDCPFETGRRMFRTGDFARVLPSGDMLYCGRHDDMVKVRGTRIQVAEVENAAMSCGGVSLAVAVQSGKGILCLIYSGTADEQVLAAQLKCKLPALMMPGRIIQVDSIPVNSHGKVDRAALKEQLAGSAGSTSALTPVEGRVLSSMRRVLGFDDIGPDDDFFRFGGNSLNVAELVSELYEVDVRVEDIYRERTARRIASAVHPGTYAEDVPSDGSVGLSLFQKRVLKSQLSDMESVMWNNPVLLRLGEDCDQDRLAAALKEVVRHHPALSCVPDSCSGNLRCASFDELPIECVHFDEGESVGEVMDKLTAPFPMSGTPLWRIRLFSLADGSYLFMDFHHLIFDGTSFCVFMNNLFRAYRGEDMPEDCFFSCVKDSERTIADVSLDGWTYALFLPASRTSEMQYLSRQLRTAVSERDIDAAGKKYGLSLDVFSIAAAGMALKECTGKSDVAVNWMYANRTSRERQNSFGAYIRMYTVFMHLEGRSRLEILTDVHDQLDLCFAGKRSEYTNKDILSGSDPVLINNLTGLDLNAGNSPFGFEKVDYPYCIKEMIEYLDVELSYDNGVLCLDVSCGNRGLMEGKVTLFCRLFVSYLEDLLMNRNDE